MKSILLKFVFALFLFASNAQAAKLVIATDEVGGAKARQLKNLILTTLPFSLLKGSEFLVEIAIIDPSKAQISCAPRKIKYTEPEIVSLVYHSAQSGITLSEADIKRYRDGYTIDRLVECDHGQLASLGVENNADHMIFVKQSPYEGGSGGDIPVILSSSRAGIGLHEWLHSFGLADEYPYAAHEAPFYCAQKWVNVGIFNDLPPYLNSDDVRTRHAMQIPWLGFLSPKAKLVTGDRLGSPEAGNLGIFPSQTCDKVVPALRSWKSSSYPTIMEDPHTNYIPKPYWTAILSGLKVSQERIQRLLKTEVVPQRLKTYELSPGNIPSTPGK